MNNVFLFAVVSLISYSVLGAEFTIASINDTEMSSHGKGVGKVISTVQNLDGEHVGMNFMILKGKAKSGEVVSKQNIYEQFILKSKKPSIFQELLGKKNVTVSGKLISTSEKQVEGSTLFYRTVEVSKITPNKSKIRSASNGPKKLSKEEEAFKKKVLERYGN